MSDITAQAESLLGGEDLSKIPEDVANYSPRENSAVSKTMIDDPEYSNKTPETTSKRVESVVVSEVVDGPDYKKLKRAMSDGEELYEVVNTSDALFTTSWDLTLLPKGMYADLKKYLQSKYVSHGLKNLLKAEVLMVSVYLDGRTVNFLDNYLVENSVPSLIPISIGIDTRVSSRVVIPAGESAIFTKKQLETLEKFEKIKMRPQGSEETSSWLGFLIFKELTKDNIENVKRSYVSREDVFNGALKVENSELHSKRSGRVSDSEVIRAEE